MSEATIELDLPPDALPHLLRLPAITGSRTGRTQSRKVRIVWHDTAAADLAADGLALAEQGRRWRLERLHPNGAGSWPPATPAPVLAEADSARELHPPDDLVPVAAFQGRERTLLLAPEPMTIRVLDGVLRSVANEAPCCRVQLCGEATPVAALAERLAADAPLSVPRDGLAAAAIAMARGEAPTHWLGAPRVTEAMTVSDALAAIIGHLTDVIAHFAPAASAGEVPSVHQMRVAVRRLRSALSVFRRAADCAELRAAGAELKSLARTLGAARDWDVFLAETAPPISTAFPGERRLDGMLGAAGRRRREAHASLRDHLADVGFRRLLLTLAALTLLRPWCAVEEADRAELLARPVGDFAARRLDRLRLRLLAESEAIEELPPHALHEVRKRAKKLRYACEFFEPLYPRKAVRRFVRRLTRWQDELGTLNDAATASALTAHLAGGVDRAFAVGAVQGFLAARAARARAELADRREAWRRQPSFWA